MIVIVDYGIGNLGSIVNMLRKTGADAIVSSDYKKIENASKLILPGVGSFDYGMQQLNQLGFSDLLRKKVLEEKTPILGICLGMQLFCKKSEEGVLDGLGWLDAEVVKFTIDHSVSHLKIPHMGWSEIAIKKESKLLKDMYEIPRFYFVHSYHVKCKDEKDILTQTSYGYEFVSAVENENIVGVQFHPEKSHKFGLKLLRNFAEYY